MGLDGIELIMAAEEEFDLRISHPDAERMTAVGDMRDCLRQTVQARGTPLDERILWERLHALIVEQLGVRPEQVTPEAQFIRDLGVG
jgi:acyl carrier protein